MIAKHGDYLSLLAEKNKVNLEFEAAVGGDIPILRTLKDGLSTNKIHKVVGILNGTCNYILSEMESSRDSFSDVLPRPIRRSFHALELVFQDASRVLFPRGFHVFQDDSQRVTGWQHEQHPAGPGIPPPLDGE